MADYIIYDPDDALVADRVTEYRMSANTPTDTVNWLKNPNLSDVSGVSQKYWKEDSGLVAEMSQGEKDIMDHGDLTAHKQTRYAEIDDKTVSLISEGFTFDGNVFSLSVHAQTNINTIKNNSSVFTWPLAVTTNDNNVYMLSEANLPGYWGAAMVATKTNLDTGRSLKKLIFDATDRAGIDAVVDTR